uniref:EGF-like domain-containing protein n=1 Tax=Ditylenchus dipsaci TaxID=166011 RepID=A0A915EUN1_9BILA
MGPCGVPKSSRSLVSNFQVGQTYNISWRMQYPHQGGYRLQLLKPDGTILEQLAPKMLTGSDALDEFAGLDDQTAACTNCTLMLERQALEWGKAYRFRSCAELNVLDEIKDDCSGKSTESRQDSKCQCEKNFSGDHCQYEDDCTLDSDCKNGGKCLTDSIQANRKSCFCAYGFFGMNCEKKSFALADDTSESFSCFAYNELLDKESSFSYGMFNTSCYKKVELNSKDLLYSRVVKNHVEIILDFVTESYVALGWRPLQIPTTCRLFPDLAASLATGVNEADRRAAATAGYLPSALNSPLHPMDCTDIIMASAADKRNRAHRPPLGPGKIFVIHAKGQTAGSYQHSVPSAIEQQSKHANVTIKNRDFYRNDQWKYHGSENRGINKLELVSAEEMAKFRSPLVHIHPDQTAASPNVGSSSRRTGEASSQKLLYHPNQSQNLLLVLLPTANLPNTEILNQNRSLNLSLSPKTSLSLVLILNQNLNLSQSQNPTH